MKTLYWAAVLTGLLTLAGCRHEEAAQTNAAVPAGPAVQTEAQAPLPVAAPAPITDDTKQATPAPQTEQAASQPDESGEPRVELTTVPRRGDGEGTWGQIGGRVRGLRQPEKYKVVIFSETTDFYIQPWANSYLTAVDADGTFETGIHLGWTYHALLVDAAKFDPSDHERGVLARTCAGAKAD